MTMTLIATSTVGAGGAASISFTGIPQTGTDLLVVFSLRSDGTASFFKVQVNGDTGSNYPFKRLTGTGSSVASAGATLDGFYVGGLTNTNETSNTFENGQLYICNYTSNVAKSASADNVTENNATAATQDIRAFSWTGTSAITSMVVTPGGGNFAQYSTASLYTITKGSGGATVA